MTILLSVSLFISKFASQIYVLLLGAYIFTRVISSCLICFHYDYVMFIVSYYSLGFTVCLVRYKYCYSSIKIKNKVCHCQLGFLIEENFGTACSMCKSLIVEVLWTLRLSLLCTSDSCQCFETWHLLSNLLSWFFLNLVFDKKMFL